MRGAHHGLDCSALSLMTPPKAGSGAGSCLPLIDMVAPGAPMVPLTCWAEALAHIDRRPAIASATRREFMPIPSFCNSVAEVTTSRGETVTICGHAERTTGCSYTFAVRLSRRHAEGVDPFQRRNARTKALGEA